MNGKRVVIIGGGFSGVRVALDLHTCAPAGTDILLISDRPHLEYYAALYRVAAGGSPGEVRVPLNTILGTTRARIVIDTVVAVDTAQRSVCGKDGTHYSYDALVIALGSESAFFGIPGLEENAFTLKSLDDALTLKNHLHAQFTKAQTLSPEAQAAACRVVVIGGGATGVELSGALAAYLPRVARKHGIDPDRVAIDIAEAKDRLMPMLDEHASARIARKLGSLGVNMSFNRSLREQKQHRLVFNDGDVIAGTVVWTAGVKPNGLLAAIPNLTVDKRARIEVDDHLRAKGAGDVWVVGDAAATTFAGMAQTAVHTGRYAAKALSATMRGKTVAPYVPKQPAYAIPVGPGWAAVSIHGMRFSGRIGWWLRRAADMRAMLTMLSLGKALRIFLEGTRTTETCDRCA